MRRLVASLGFAAAVTFAANAQQPAFKSGIDLVTVDVVVTDAAGNPVRNLTAADFEILEDGVLQPIQAFHFFSVASSPLATSLPPGLFSNDIEPAGIFAIVLDEFGLEVTDVRDVRRSVERFLRASLRPNDYVAVIRSGTSSGLLFANDVQLALDAVSNSTGVRDRGMRITQPGAAEEPGDILDRTARFQDVETAAGGRSGEKSFDVLLGVVEKLESVRGRRKAILWVSRGGDLAFRRTSDLDTGLADGRADGRFVRLLDRARAANVAIYGVDPRGLVANTEVGSVPPDDLGTMRDIAAATGGRAIVNTNDVAGALARAAEENRAYYLLGYAPRAGGERPRRLEVRTRVAGVSLLHRTFYVPPDPKTRVEAPPFAASLLPVRDLPITLAPAAVVDDRRRTGVVVAFAIGSGLGEGQRVEYSVFALDPAGREAARANGRVAIIDGAASGTAMLPLNAGTYQLRLAARLQGSETRGLALATFEVPGGRAAAPSCAGFAFSQRNAPQRFRHFTRAQSLTVTTLISAEALPATGLAFGIGTTGRAHERAFPVATGRPVGNGLWQLSLTLNAPLPGGVADVTVLQDGKPLGDTCLATVRLQ